MYVFLLLCLMPVMCLFPQQQYFLPITPPYNLQFDECYTKYLPARVHELKNIINKDGLHSAISFIRDDRDLESYVFIVSLEKPEKLLAYSRQPQLFDKTATELQKLIFSSPELDKKYNAQAVFTRWISTAQKGDTYIPYFWRFNNSDPIKIQVAYVSLMKIDMHEYVVGATIFVKTVPDYIILPHRVKTVFSKLKGDNLDEVLKLISNDPVPDLYFFIDAWNPYLAIVNGNNPALEGLTADEQQKKLTPTCADETCDINVNYDKVVPQAKRGAGFVAYAWRAHPEDPIKLKLSYIMPFSYKKQKLYFLGTGYTPFDLPDHLCDDLLRVVTHTLKLVSEIGLNSALSVIKKTNTPKLYQFVVEADPPYKILIHITENLIGKNAQQATAYSRSKKFFGVDYSKMLSGMAQFARDGGGFYAYEYQAPVAYVSRMLKFAYIKLFTINGKNYFVGSTYETF